MRLNSVLLVPLIVFVSFVTGITAQIHSVLVVIQFETKKQITPYDQLDLHGHDMDFLICLLLLNTNYAHI
jgi:hypothetical protein